MNHFQVGRYAYTLHLCLGLIDKFRKCWRFLILVLQFSLHKSHIPCTIESLCCWKTFDYIFFFKFRIFCIYSNKYIFYSPESFWSSLGFSVKMISIRWKENEHLNNKITKPKHECNIKNKSEPHLYTLEALFVRELKPFINTQLKDDYKSRKLRILI